MTTRPPVFHALTATAQEWRRIVEHLPLACVPVASMGFHGYHLPHGTDLLLTTAACEHLLYRFGGMLFPPLPWPDRAGGEGTGLIIRTARDLLEKGFHVVVFLGPPCREPAGALPVAPGDLPETGERPARVIFTTIRELSRAGSGDELGSTLETSLMMRLHPGLVKLPVLDDPRYGTGGIIGPAPHATASPQKGREWFDALLDILTAMVKDARAGQAIRPAWYYAQKHGETIP
ncbi:MAG TPA: hypothetical protein PK349_06005 [Candidatus Hydrogenedentes bacterium]|nr:hypothetical protein [Candidatus Hydrogenedentota bacterium]